MIFLSHNKNDKPVVEQVALRLRNIYGQEKVFYDSWSIQPGEGIIDKMEKGLTNCKYFFYFVSSNSLKSNMVKMEWQNALFKAATGTIKFIAIRLDNSNMPFIISQNLYIDLYSQGLEVAVRQIVDVINGTNTYKNPNAEFSNLKAFKYKIGNKVIVECRALYYLEPITDFAFATLYSISDIKVVVQNEPTRICSQQENCKFENGARANMIFRSVSHGTTPQMPFIVEFTSIKNPNFDIFLVLHKDSHNHYSPIPLETLQK